MISSALSRRNLIALGALSLPSLTGCNFVREYNKNILDSAGKPWSYQSGHGYERFEVRAGDHWRGDTSERSEIAVHRYMQFGKPVWQSFSMLIEAGPPSEAPWSIFGQWHAFKDPWDEYVSPPIALLLKDGKFAIVTASDKHIQQTHKNYPPFVTRYAFTDVAKNAWHDFVYRIVFDPAGSGSLHVWHNGQAIVAQDGLPIGYNDIIGPFFKYGVYRGPGDPNPLAARYANVEIGYDSLASRITSPKPVPGRP